MSKSPTPEGVFSFLDTDLYKLTMQCAILKFFPTIEVEYAFNNRTPHMRLNRPAFEWLQEQVARLANITLSNREEKWLRKHCHFLTEDYLSYLRDFRLQPEEQVQLSFSHVNDDFGDLSIITKGLWVETVLYEIPLLALTSEAYFKFVDRDWTHADQEEKAYDKGITLLKHGCLVSEFGSRRRRDFHTQDLVIQGLVRASKEDSLPGKLTGTSNVYFAMEHGIPPVGTVAHEWYMGIAAITDDYEHANELGLKYWLACYGEGVLGIALTDTFGTEDFFKAFQKHIPARRGSAASAAEMEAPSKTYAHVFAGVRQDSGDPKKYLRQVRDFYDSVGIKEAKSVVHSDALNMEKCIEYKDIGESLGLRPSFGIGTFFTNDFVAKSDSQAKSKPLNIVIKLSRAGGRPAIKLSDDKGKHTGHQETVQQVKTRLGYTEREWADESNRW